MRTEDMWHRDPLAVYCVRGTEAHAGASGEAEESAARLINATQDGHGHSSRHELWLRLGPHYLAHCAHTLGTTSSPSYETTALCREYVDAASEAGKWGLPPPDWVVRSHRHRHAEVRLPTRHARATVIVTAGWQLRTPFSYRTAGGRTLLPQVGGSVIIAGDHEPYSRSYVRAVERDKPEVV